MNHDCLIQNCQSVHKSGNVKFLSLYPKPMKVHTCFLSMVHHEFLAKSNVRQKAKFASWWFLALKVCRITQASSRAVIVRVCFLLTNNAHQGSTSQLCSFTTEPSLILHVIMRNMAIVEASLADGGIAGRNLLGGFRWLGRIDGSEGRRKRIRSRLEEFRSHLIVVDISPCTTEGFHGIPIIYTGLTEHQARRTSRNGLRVFSA
jgi:hypothetical protein